ncbi:Outer membrane protein A precursor [Rubrivivax sp. A210]|uniref:OmpA family protein n=1 Tax=Rubrivivax sp. A210 TaxID=2772301 RepID=UPI00191875A0|nr:OmpA family protein [Rubrivivax sp. A210]CAD5365895.1 Outer membrane protein A precursor [Rubrivivax sp. A210]
MNNTHALSRFGLAALGLLLGGGAAPALAQDEGYAYGGLSVGQSRARIDEARITASLLGSGLTTTSMSRDERDTGFKLFGGYQFNRWFGLEAGYFKLGKFGFESTTTPAGTLAGEISLKGFNLDLVGTLPLTTYLSAIGRVGVQTAKATDRFSGTGAVTVLDPNPSKRSTQPKFGLGLQYEVTRNFLVRGEIERYRVNDAVGNKGDVNLISVGLVIPFGRAPEAAPQRTSMAPAYVPPPAPAPAPPPPVVMAPREVPPPPPMIVAAPPPAPPVVVPPPRRRVSFSADSLFGFDHSEIRPEGRAALDVFVSEMKGTRYDVITVEGHTDRLGSTAYNEALSGRRADTVKAYLVGTGGLEASKITVAAKGEAEPVSKPDECKGNKANAKLIACLQADRRVEVEVAGTQAGTR